MFESLGEGGEVDGWDFMPCRRRAPLEASSLICLRWASVRPGRESDMSITRTSVGSPLGIFVSAHARLESGYNTYNVQAWLSLMFVAEQIPFKSHDESSEHRLVLNDAHVQS
jgi:hypothetical protein